MQVWKMALTAVWKEIGLTGFSSEVKIVNGKGPDLLYWQFTGELGQLKMWYQWQLDVATQEDDQPHFLKMPCTGSRSAENRIYLWRFGVWEWFVLALLNFALSVKYTTKYSQERDMDIQIWIILLFLPCYIHLTQKCVVCLYL